jgi:hypothetical protein
MFNNVESEAGVEGKGLNSSQWLVIGAVVVMTVGSLVYRVLEHEHLGHTAAMFVGLPAVLAILLAASPRAKSATGGILKGITLAMLIVAPLLGEGVVCILMASPLFYLVGIIVGAIADWQRRRRSVTLSCCALALLPMSLEGVVPALTFGRMQTVSVTRVVDGTPAQVEAALARSPRLDTPIVGFFPRVGFPQPLQAHGDGLEVGAPRVIHFAGAEGVPPGDLVMRVGEYRPGFVRFDAVSDVTKLGYWLHWDDSEVTWRAVDAMHTEVTWQIQFERKLDPAWYFGPWERLAVHDAANYLIEANATPVR